MRTIANRSFALTLLVLAACGGDQQSRRTGANSPDVRDERIAVVEAVPPHVTQPLLAADGTMLSVRDVVATDSGLLILDGSSSELWQLDLTRSTTPPLNRVSRPRQFGQGDVFAMAAHSAGLSVIGIDGALRVMRRADADRLAYTIRAFRPIHRPIALGEWPSARWVAVHSVVVLQGTPVDSVIVSAVDSAGRVSRLFGYERSGPSRPGAFMVDPVSARALRDRVLLVGADPARVITISATGTRIDTRIDTLLDPPRRELSAVERAGLEKMLTDPRTPAALRSSRRPEQRPAARAALPFAGGYLVAAQGGEDAQFLDLYCGRTFRRTLISRAGLNDVFVVEGGIVTVDEPPSDAPERPQVLSFYRSKDFLNECAK